MLAFYKTPLGKKLIAEEPHVLDQSMNNAEAWANRLREEMIGDARRNEEARARHLSARSRDRATLESRHG